MTRFGTIVLAGKPNAGKSTLLNALVGQDLAIVSPKPQSTRLPVMGLYTKDDTQVLFVDPPGLLDPSYALQRSMIAAAHEALEGADAVLHVHPATDGSPPPLVTLLGPAAATLRLPSHQLTVLSQVDRSRKRFTRSASTLPVSAKTGKGIAALLEWCQAAVPEGAFRYAADDISTQPLRFFATEYVREAAFAHLDEEVPYSVAADVDEFRESSDPVYIRMALYVERDSQRGIIIGAGGKTLRAIGTQARRRIEQLIGQRVFLDLWVKVMPNWRSRPQALRRLGFSIPPKESA